MLIVAHLLGLAVTAFLVYSHVPEPYMDEIFHVPQAQQYCQGDYFTWDPKLTTPPGLYIVSNLIALVGKPFGFNLCTANALRFTNILFSIGLYFTLASLISTLNHSSTVPSWKSKLYGLTLAWFPVGSFYNFLYYTDSGSTFFVLLSYLLVKKNRPFYAGIVGIISLTFRQTNVIWVCLFMVVTIIDNLSTAVNSSRDTKKNDDESTSTAIALYNPKCNAITSPVQAVQSISSLIVNTLTHIGLILPKIFTFLLAIVLFGVFLIWNGGIVLGDRSNHVAGLHFPQLFYYTSFLSFFAAPWTFSFDVMLDLIVQTSIKRIILGIASSFLTLFLVYKYTYEHPFILSDNRHYTFYIWKKIYRRHWTVRYFMSPIYIVSEYLNFQAFAQNTSFLLTLGYVCVLILSLVPSPLFEFRYYITPFLFYMVHIPPSLTSTSRTLIGLFLYAGIHIVTFYMFLYKPFSWPSEPGKSQRFMW